VDPADPEVIYDPGGRFTQAMADDENAIGLNAVNDQNAGAWRIMDYLGPNRVRIDYVGRPAYGWTPETQIAGRIWDVDGLSPGDGAWIMFDAPAPSRMQVRLERTAYNNCQIFIRPSGQDVTGTGDDIAFAAGTCTLTDAAGDFKPNHVGRNITIAGSGAGNNGTFVIASYISATQITYANASGATESPFTGTWTVDGDPAETEGKQLGYVNTDRTRMQMVADGADVLFYDMGDDSRANIHLIGELDGAETEDADCNVLWGTNSVTTVITIWRATSYMLDENGLWLDGWPTLLKVGWDTDVQHSFISRAGRRLVNGYAFLRQPWLVMADVAAGGYVRGRLPIIRFTWEGFAQFQPLDGGGLWQYVWGGLAAPRNGPNDPLVLKA
jgi:hypothetical protein